MRSARMPKKYMTDNTDEKINLRKRFQALRNQLHSAEKDARIREHVSRLAGASFFVYYSVKSEVDTHGILSDLLQRGKCVCLPHIEGRQMIAAPYFGGALPAGMYGIPAPASEQDLLCEVALVPLLAVDRAGNRLGYGGGYYDRYFAAHPNLFRVGLCYKGQVVDRLPAEPTDVPLHAIVTEEGLHCLSKT